MASTDRSLENMRRVVETCEIMHERLQRLTTDMQDWHGDASEVRRLLGLLTDLRLSADRLKRDQERLRLGGRQAAVQSTRSMLAVAFQTAIERNTTEVIAPTELAIESVCFPASVFTPRDVLRLLLSARKSGTFTIVGAQETYKLDFDRGDLINAGSEQTPPGLRLGEILVAKGMLSQSALDDFLRRHQNDRAKIGRALEAEELVTKDQIHAALRHQVDRLFDRLLSEREATSTFMPVPASHRPDGLTFDLAELLLSR